MKTYTAREVIYAYLGLKHLCPNPKDWKISKLSGNPPRLYRLQQLNRLCDAFSVGPSTEFAKGRFVRLHLLADYREVLDLAARELVTNKVGLSEELFEHDGVEYLFKELLDYRTNLDSALRFSSGVLEASGLYYFAHHRIKRLNTKICDNVDIVEDVLELILSPIREKFSAQELIAEYGFPDVDLSNIDADWM
jgi:hypothetical protein